VTTPKPRAPDGVGHLATPEAQAGYLSAAFAGGDPAAVTEALGVIARARGMTEVAKAAGVGRESLYKALGEGGNPTFATVFRVVTALGMTLHVAPSPKDAA
jgi:probable addiction module antidote protein